ncbi:hypothetical protein FQA39_LY05839 [Lamprigera yunnana]|nr:hypothetical protein FQA39_LY05839 [Lamprigera yunnana]
MLSRTIIFMLINILPVRGEVFNNQSDKIYELQGDLNLGFILNECSNTSSSSWTYANSAIWTISRLNYLNFTSPLRMGLKIYQSCTEDDSYDILFDMFKNRNLRYFLNVFSNRYLGDGVSQFGNVLNIHLTAMSTYHTWALRAAAKLLSALNYRNNITVYMENDHLLSEFYAITRNEDICIKSGIIVEPKPKAFVKPTNGTIMVFAKYETIKALLLNFTRAELTDIQMIFVPSDASINIDVPEGSYIIEPSRSISTIMKNTKLITSPLFFDIASLILETIVKTVEFVFQNCNDTVTAISCLRKNHQKFLASGFKMSPIKSMEVLEMEQLTDSFTYNIFQVENVTTPIFNVNSSSNDTKRGIFQSFVNVFRYSIFNDTLSGLELLNSTARSRLCPMCRSNCVNFFSKQPPKTITVSYAFSKVGLRTDSWVFSFLAISLLGVVLCLAVFIFVMVSICKKDILEGNAFLTLLLLLVVILMYCSVIPFALDGDKEARTCICIARALSTTLNYALAFSLLLSRSILLATISKEVGFMAHVPGPVQAFMTLFIFGVQGAISLQFISHCEDIFRGISFVYLMSYNVILLVLLLFICPLNTRSQRNYREGRYFTVAIALIACVWSCWIPAYAVFHNEWRDPIICFGLVSTASIFLGAVFVPRTYMMTVAATRDRLTSALPSLHANSSIVDVYRASTQPIYDCINIAAINARCGPPPPPPPLPQAEVYSTPTEPYEDEFDLDICVTPNADKVTRF